MQNRESDTIKIEKIYEMHFDRVYKFFYYRVLSQEIAEDLTSSTFLTLVEILKQSGTKKIEDPNKIIYGIAKNIFLQYLKKKYRSEIPFSIMGENFEEFTPEREVEVKTGKTPEEKIKKYIEMLPDRQQEVARLRLLEKMNLKAIAVKLGKNMNYVKVTQRRALRNLKILVETRN